MQEVEENQQCIIMKSRVLLKITNQKRKTKTKKSSPKI